MIISCTDLIEYHCTSCHEDQALGYDLSEWEFEIDGEEILVRGCCFLENVEEKVSKFLAKRI